MVAEQVKADLNNGVEATYYWLFTSSFATWANHWGIASGYASEEDGIDVALLRSKMIETMWRPRRRKR